VLEPTASTIVVAAIGALATITVAVVGRWRGKRERKAALDGLAASAAAAVQNVYQDVITDLQAQVEAARLEARSSRDASREAQRLANEAEANAWRAEQWCREMQRFLAELRPVIARYVPDADELIARLDRVSTSPASRL
jgi:hypothetical protein